MAGIALVGVLSFSCQGICGSPVTEWKVMVDAGKMEEARGAYSRAIPDFAGAAALAERVSLPSKYTAIALCLESSASIRARMVGQANLLSDRLIDLLKKDNSPLDPDLEVWLLDLADAYQEQPDLRQRQTSLEHAFLLKILLYKTALPDHPAWLQSARALTEYYAQHKQTKRALEVMCTVEDAQLQRIRKGFTCSDEKGQARSTVDVLWSLALHRRELHSYDEAKRALLQMLDLIERNPQGQEVKLPAGYALLGMTLLPQGNASECNRLFARAKAEALKFRGQKDKQTYAALQINSLTPITKSDREHGNAALAEQELRQLLDIEEHGLVECPSSQYQTLTLLADFESNQEEVCQHLSRAISIAKLPNSFVKRDIPDLWKRIGLARTREGKFSKSYDAFSHAFGEETDKTGFHATEVLVFWSGLAAEQKQYALALEKARMALRNAELMPPQQRGTLMIDALFCVAGEDDYFGKLDEAKQLRIRLANEIKLQRSLRTGLGPNFFQQLWNDKLFR